MVGRSTRSGSTNKKSARSYPSAFRSHPPGPQRRANPSSPIARRGFLCLINRLETSAKASRGRGAFQIYIGHKVRDDAGIFRMPHQLGEVVAVCGNRFHFTRWQSRTRPVSLASWLGLLGFYVDFCSLQNEFVKMVGSDFDHGFRKVFDLSRCPRSITLMTPIHFSIVCHSCLPLSYRG